MSTSAYANQREAIEEMSNDGVTAFMHFNENASLPTFIPWNDRIENFPVEALADMLDAGGVKLLIFTITHHDYNLPFPVPSNASSNMKNLYSGRDADRDLMGDIHRALADKGIKLGFYFNPMPDTEEQAFQDEIGFPSGDWVENVYETVQMTSDKYGDRIFAWWIDNMAKNSNSAKIDRAELAERLRSGNPDALIGYNVGGQSSDRQIPFSSDNEVDNYTNFTAGHLKNKDLNYLKPASKFDTNGLLNYRLDHMQRGWAVQEPDSETGGSWHNGRYTMVETLEYMHDLRSVGAVVSWNVAPYLDGDIDERVVNQWVMIGQGMKHGKTYVWNTNENIRYEDGFTKSVTDLGASDANMAQGTSFGSTATYKFKGSRVELWGKRQSNGGECRVSLNGKTIETVSQQGSTLNQYKFFDSGPLKSGDYTIEVRMEGGSVCTLDHLFYTPELSTKTDGAAFDYGSGWDNRERDVSFGNTIHYTNADNRSADFDFTGDRFQIFSQVGKDGGAFEVWIDDELVETKVDTYNTSKLNQVLVYSSPILVPGNHTVRIRSKHNLVNASATNKYVHIDYIQYNKTVPRGYVIDSIHHDIDYDNEWEFQEKSAAHFNFVSFSKTTNSLARYRFNGTGIKVFVRTDSAGGKCQIRIDGNLQRTVDLYSSSSESQVEIFSKQTLTDGDHTLDFVVDGTKNSDSSNFYCVLDRFEVTP